LKNLSKRKAYSTDVSDAEWALVATYLTLMTEDAPQRDFPLREVFNGLRRIVRSDSSWRMTPHDLPPWHVVYQQPNSVKIKRSDSTQISAR
jgi:transposase